MAEAQPITLDIEGMTCANCAMGVRKTLQQQGFENVSVNFAAGEATFRKPPALKLDRAIKAVRGLGYQASLHRGTREDTAGFSAIERKFLAALVFTLPLFLHMFVAHDHFLNRPLVQLLLCLPVMALGVAHFGRSAFFALRSGVPNMDVLIFTGSSAAFIYSLVGIWRYAGTPEVHNYLFFETAATIITLVLLGNVLEHRSVKKTTTAIRELGRLQPTRAKRLRKDGLIEQTEEVDYAALKPGDRLLVNSGDRIPVDGTIEFGSASVDESMLTGESLPVTRQKGEPVIGGTVVLDGNFTLKVETLGEDSVLARIIRMVKQAQDEKPSIQRLGDRVSAVFVPVVIGIALLTFGISYWVAGLSASAALMHSIAVLVISCPCAMGLATPTAVMAGIGRAARAGVLIRGGATLETLATIQTVVFDKTGTLTTGAFEVEALHALEVPETALKSIVLGLEQHSSHPIAISLLRAWPGTMPHVFDKVQEQRGIGLEGTDPKGNRYRIGSARLLSSAPETPHDLYVLKNDTVIGTIDLRDQLKDGAKDVVHALHRLGIRTVLLSGDREAHCAQMATDLALDEYHAEQLPEQKLEKIAAWSQAGVTAMVGDGINDAPALAKAHVGISMSHATEVAIQSAQVVLLSAHDLSRLSLAHRISGHTLRTIRQNLFWAFAYNVVAIPIAALGLLNPMVAALSMAFSDVLVIGNSIRLNYKRLE